MDDEIELDYECKIYLAFKYNSDNLSETAIIDSIIYLIESEGYGKLIDLEIK